METSPNEPVGRIPKARLAELVWSAVVAPLDNPVAEAKFLNAPDVLDQTLAVAAGLVLAKEEAVPTEEALTPSRVVQPFGNPLPRESKF